MISQYLEMLKNSLVEKSSILSSLTVMSENQKEIVTKDSVDWDSFDEIVEKKAELIDRLNVIDSGFDSVFGRIRDELGENKVTYKKEIQNIQQLINEVTEKSTSLMALEERNKVLVTNSFKNARQKLNQGMMNNRVASNYYKAMSRVNFIDPQLMDKKK